MVSPSGYLQGVLWQVLAATGSMMHKDPLQQTLQHGNAVANAGKESAAKYITMAARMTDIFII
jgi:hypothetical protein